MGRFSIFKRRHSSTPISAYWWQFEPPHKLNFGDELTPYIISKLFKIKVTHAHPSLCEVAAVGSILEIIHEHANDNKINIWGSGFIKPGNQVSGKQHNYLAVRGKFTASRIIQSEKITLGDPGLLISKVFKPERAKRYKVGIIPHYVDYSDAILKEFSAHDNVKIINVLDDIEKIVSEINSCESIFSSSLHGLIVSDAYDIPNYWLPLSDKLTGGDYKFRDYYSLYNLEPPKATAADVRSQLLTSAMSLQFKSRTERVRKIQRDLINSFPA